MTVVEPKRCLNCEAVLLSMYCGECGQKAGDSRLTVRQLMAEAVEAVFNVDSKLLRTLGGLIRPGHLTEAYLAGRRARYLRPVTLYLLMSALMLTLASLGTPSQSTTKLVFRGYTLEVTHQGTGRGAKVIPNEKRPSNLRLSHAIRERAEKRFATTEGQESYIEAIRDYRPKLLFALVPLLAVFLRVIYERQKRLYLEHLVFALHLCAFGFLALALFFSVAKPLPIAIKAFFPLAMVVVMMGYFVLALKRVYGDGWFWTVMKAILVPSMYLMSFFAAERGWRILALWL
jgi:hypothetical protein